MAADDAMGACKDVSMRNIDGAADIDKEGSTNISKATNHGVGKKIQENEFSKGERPGRSESSQYQGQLIPTCISPFQPSTNVFAL